jgi:hypothetical protein
MHSNGLSADLKHIFVMENQRKQLQQAEDQLFAAALSAALTLSHDNLYKMFALAFGLQVEKDRQQKAVSEAEGIAGQVLAGGLHLRTSQHVPQVSANHLSLTLQQSCIKHMAQSGCHQARPVAV